MTYALAVTGPVKVSTSALLIIDRVIEQEGVGVSTPDGSPARKFISGAAYGVDSLAAIFATRYLPNAEFVLTIHQGCWHNVALADTLRSAGVAVRERRCPGWYMARNDATIALARHLVAFPTSSAEAVRSGTWATVRRARKARLSIAVYPLDGSRPWRELRSGKRVYRRS